MPLTWHPTTASELDACLAIQPEMQGAALIGAQAARTAWFRLLRHPACITATLVTEDVPPRLAGFGCSVLVRREILDAELANPQPDVNSRFLAAYLRGDRILLDRDEVAAANGGGGLDVLILIGTVVPDRLTDVETQMMSAASFVESHLGHRLSRVAVEYAAPYLEIARLTNFYREVAHFASERRSFFLTTREWAESRVGSIARPLFLYHPPTLDLRPSDQELLQAALRGGAIDEELAVTLGLTVAAVKARWRSTFARIAEKRPDLIGDPAWGHDGEATVRGTQKRHRVLAYVRDHPSELRPYARPRDS